MTQVSTVLFKLNISVCVLVYLCVFVCLFVSVCRVSVHAVCPPRAPSSGASAGCELGSERVGEGQVMRREKQWFLFMSACLSLEEDGFNSVISLFCLC